MNVWGGRMSYIYFFACKVVQMKAGTLEKIFHPWNFLLKMALNCLEIQLKIEVFQLFFKIEFLEYFLKKLKDYFIVKKVFSKNYF